MFQKAESRADCGSFHQLHRAGSGCRERPAARHSVAAEPAGPEHRFAEERVVRVERLQPAGANVEEAHEEPEQRAADLGFGRIVGSEIEAPNMFANPA